MIDSRQAARALALAAIAFLLPLAAAPEVVHDGSLGAAGPPEQVLLPDGFVDYRIAEASGQRVGGRNLFHSFGRFDLTSSEIATFEGSAGIANVIGRVTGGASSIDGLVRTDGMTADVFLINPEGIVFGEGARLDVAASFAVSTADAIELRGGGMFSAAPEIPTILTMADPSAFRFAAAEAASLEVRGGRLAVGPDQRLSLVGGDLALGGGVGAAGGVLSAPAGRIDLVSVHGSGSVALFGDAPVDAFETLGDIEIRDGMVVNTGGVAPDADITNVGVFPVSGAGPIFIHARDLTIEDADIRSLTVTNEDGQDLVFDLRGDLTIRKLTEAERSGIFSGTGLRQTLPAEGRQGLSSFGIPGIYLHTVDCDGQVCVVTLEGDGDAGDIDIEARRIALERGGRIGASSEFGGAAGEVDLRVEESIRIAGFLGQTPDGVPIRSGILSNAQGSGSPGAILVRGRREGERPDLRLADFGAIVIENGAESLPENEPGRIDLEVRDLSLFGNARIDTSTDGAGQGGSIEIDADRVELRGRQSGEEFSGITSFSQGGSTGDAGDVTLSARRLSLAAGAEISARPDPASEGEPGQGDAGNLTLRAGEVLRMRVATIATSTDFPTAAGGNVVIEVGSRVDLRGSTISTSVRQGAEPGGNILIDPRFVVLDGSRIIARADAGAGGNIEIRSDFLLQDAGSVVSASSVAGIDGEIVAEPPESDIAAQLTTLDTPAFGVAQLLREPCAARRSDAGSFVLEARVGIGASPDDYLPAPQPAEADGASSRPGPRNAATPGARAPGCPF